MTNHVLNASIENIYSLTPMQEGFLFNNITNTDTSAYEIETVFSTGRTVNEQALRSALRLLAKRYEVLRTAILYKGLDKPRQIVLRERQLGLSCLDFRLLTDEVKEKRLKQEIDAELDRGFDLQEDPLFRICLIHYGAEEDKLIVTFHHIIMDGWCISILFNTLMSSYQNLLDGVSPADLEQKMRTEKNKTLPYSSYVKWLDKQDHRKALNYWRDLLLDFDGSTAIKGCGGTEKNSIRTDCGQVSYHFTHEESTAISRLAADCSVTVSTVAELAWGLVLQRYNFSDDALFGKVVSGRNADLPGIEQSVGLYINTVPVRVMAAADSSVREMLALQQRQAIDGSEYEYCSLAEVQRVAQLAPGLIQSLLVCENYAMDVHQLQDHLSNLKISIESNSEQTEYPLTLTFSWAGEKLLAGLKFKKNVYSEEEAALILRRTCRIISGMAENPDRPVKELSLLLPGEKTRILTEFNSALPAEETKYELVTERFAHEAALHPNRPAVISDKRTLTYAELDLMSNAIYAAIRKCGVKKGERVALICQRSVYMIAGIIGIMKSGAVYVPIDPDYPAERIRFILSDSAASLFLTDREETNIGLPCLPLISSCTDARLSEEGANWREQGIKPEDEAYVIYTSGSSGRPKGVEITHGNLAYFLSASCDIYAMSGDDVVLQHATYCFDMSIAEIFVPLCSGAQLCVISKTELYDPAEMCAFVAAHHVTVLPLTPTLIRELDPADYPSVRILNSGGEAGDLPTLLKWSSKARVINAYGPTETTIFSVWDEIKPDTREMTIGKPIEGSQAFILQGNRQCGVGIMGELCIAGPCVGRGYLNRPDLTAERFIDNPFGPGKLYRTGDLAFWMPDGRINCVGRCDSQVKIRGFRIELEEIDSCLRKLPEIDNAAVIVRQDDCGGQVMLAYITSSREVNLNEVKNRLATQVPAYMVPDRMMQLDALPVSATGKLNRRLLPDIPLVSTATASEAQPLTETEEKVATVFAHVLGLAEVGAEDDFFRLGGHSIKLISLCANLLKSCHISVPAAYIFAHPTVRQIAAYIDGHHCESEQSITAVPEAESYILSSSQQEIWIMVQTLAPEEAAVMNIPFAAVLQNADRDRLRRCLIRLGRRHEALRTSIRVIDGEARQVILPEDSLAHVIRTVDMRKSWRTTHDPDKLLAETVEAEISTAFQVDRDVLSRVLLAELNEQDTLLVITLHHLISDNLSHQIMLRDLTEMYNADAEGRKQNLPQLTVQNKDYAVWHRNMLAGERGTSLRQYWENILNPLPPALRLKTDFTRPAVKSVRGESLYWDVPAKTTAFLRQNAGKQKLTVFMQLLTALYALLYTYSGQSDLVVGTVVDTRTNAQLEDQVGYYLNVLPLRLKFDPETSVSQLERKVREMVAGAIAHQDYPFVEIMREVGLKQRRRDALFNVFIQLVTSMPMESVADSLKGVRMRPVPIPSDQSKYDLVFNFTDTGTDLFLKLEFSTSLFKRATVQRMLDRFTGLLDRLDTDTDCTVRQLAENETQVRAGKIKRVKR